MISSNFLGAVKKSCLMSFCIIYLTTKRLLCFINRFELMLVLATLNDHAVSLSFNSFAFVHLSGVASMGCGAKAGSFDGVGAKAVNKRLPCHEPTTWLHLSDLQNCGPCYTFRHIGQCHRQLIVQFNVLVVFSVTAIGSRLGYSERPLRDPLFLFSSLVLRINIPQPCSNFACKPSEWCAARPALRGESLPSLNRSRFPVASIRVLLMCSIALARLCDDTASCSTRWRVLPSTAVVRGQFVNSLLKMSYVAGSVIYRHGFSHAAPLP